MRDFDFAEPASLSEACSLLAGDPDGSVVFAGGTDILVDLKAGARRLRRLVSLGRIEGLGGIEIDADGGLTIGAMTTVNQVARHGGVEDHFPGINDAAMSLAAEQVRNQATVAGNLCMAVPSADMAPILLAHGAAMRVVSPVGERVVPLREFFIGPRKTVLEAADIVVAIDVPAPEPGAGAAAIRQGGRVSLSLPMASVAAVVVMEGEVCREAMVALGAVAPTPIVALKAAERLVGKELTGEVLDEAGELAAAAATPIDDIRATREYRLELIKVLTRRVLRAAAERAKENF
ncbi:MAG: xanthine dehydrogenase family protein subunit M [Thermoanaerobaculales bacterium]